MLARSNYIRPNSSFASGNQRPSDSLGMGSCTTIISHAYNCKLHDFLPLNKCSSQMHTHVYLTDVDVSSTAVHVRSSSSQTNTNNTTSLTKVVMSSTQEASSEITSLGAFIIQRRGDRRVVCCRTSRRCESRSSGGWGH